MVRGDGGFAIVFIKNNLLGESSQPQEENRQIKGKSSPQSYAEESSADDELIPLVDSNLLVDRFVVTGTELKSKMEVRFKRSRNKMIPQSNKDSLGSQDMQGEYFYEPTQELDFVGQLSDGWFDALLLPTQISGIQRWQFFLYNPHSTEIDSFNVERDSDGLFNTKGTRYYTSPDPEYQDAVFERSPGTCPFTGEPLIPIPPSKSGYGEWALEFDGTDDNVEVAHSDSIDFDHNEDFAIEAWIAVSGEAVDSDIITKWQGGSEPYPYAIRYSAGNGTVLGLRYDGTNSPSLTSTKVINDGEFHHIAFVKNGSTLYLYIDGEEDGSTEDTTTGSTKNNVAIYFASRGTDDYFLGQIDEVRIWNRSLAQDEIQENMNYRLVGNEPGLVGYWRFDEGAGNILHDQTDNGNHGTINGATWVQSQAPIGDSPGIRRTSFGFEGRTINSAPSAMLYYQQEQAQGGYDEEAKPIKSNARVILGVGTGGLGLDGESTDKTYVAAVDFALSGEGKLAQIPDDINLGEALEGGTEEDLARLQELQQEVEELRRQEGISLLYHHNEVDSRFGQSVAIDGNWVLVGAPAATVDGIEAAGKAYLFQWDGSNWNLNTTLSAEDDAECEAGFGWRVAIDDDWVLVGAPAATVDGIEVAGKAYLFQWDGSNWNLNTTLSAEDDAECEAGFGWSVAIDGDWALVGRVDGVAGKAYMFQWDGSNWSQQTILTPKYDGGLNDFGWYLAIDGEWAIIGSYQNNSPFYYQVFVFHWDDSQWNQEQILTGTQENPLFSFSISVAISSNYLLVGVPDTKADVKDSGVTDVYRQTSNGKWELETTLTAGADIQEYDDFGNSVAIYGGQSIIGATGLESIYSYTQGVPQQLLDEIDALRQKVGDAVTLPMNFLHTDPFGLTVSGALLGFAPSQNASQFLDSTTGNLTLYFRGDQDQFFAAYYNTNTAKTEYKLATELATTNADQLTFVARFAGEETNDTTITVEDGDSADFCQVTISNESTGITETWQRVPRKVKLFAAVFNGVANQQVFLDNLGTAITDSVTSLTLSTGAKYPLKSGDVLLVNETKVTVAGDVERKATEVPIENITLSADANAPVYLIPYDYQTLPTTNRVGDSLENGSLLLSVVTKTIRNDKVTNGTGTGSVNGASNFWIAEAPGSSLFFDGENYYVSLDDDSKVSKFDAVGDVTIEAWVVADQVTVDAQVIHHKSDNSQYSLGLKQQILMSALVFDGTDSCYVEFPPESIPSGNEITISFWAYGGDSQPKSNFLLYASDGEDNDPDSDNRIVNIHLPYSDGSIFFDCGNDGTNYDRINKEAQESEYKGIWSHWAFTKNATTGEMKIYLNGELWHSGEEKNKTLPPVKSVRLGKDYDGQLDELRIWNRARTQTEIQADMNRRLGGNESGLVGYWHFDQREDNQVKDLTGNGYNGTIHGDPQNIASPPNLGAYSVVAGVGNLLLESKEFLYCNLWNHLALAYNQSYALKFDGQRDYLDCGNNTILNLQEMTVEVLLQISSTNKCGILAKGTLNSGDPEQNVPYALYTENSKVIFVFEDEDGASYQVETSGVLETNKVYKIAVTRKKYTESVGTGSSAENTFTGTAPDLSSLSTWDDINANSDDIDTAMQGNYVASQQRGQELANLQSPDSWTNPEFTPGSQIAQWNEVKIYIDGVPEANQSLPRVNCGYNSDSLEIARMGESYLAGEIGEVRLWSIALGVGEIGQKLTGDEYGLVSWWSLEENEGNIAYDSKSSNHAQLKGPELD